MKKLTTRRFILLYNISRVEKNVCVQSMGGNAKNWQMMVCGNAEEYSGLFYRTTAENENKKKKE